MSRLTVTEKEHWKSRIEQRINKAIESLETKDVSLMPSIRAKAETEAHKSLGTAEMHAKIQAIRQQRDALEAEQKQLESTMYLHTLGKDATRHGNEYRLSSDFWSLHSKHRARFEDELLAESAIGQEILKLRSEKDALLDTVWLATSSAQISDLWGRVSVVLGDDATLLQRQILTQDAEPIANI